MTHVKIEPDVFNDIYIPYLNENARTQIYFGGAGSGKSVFLAQRAIIDLLKGGRNYLICRAVAKTIRHSVFKEITKLIDNWNLGGLFDTNKTEMVITCSNGYQAMFAGLDDVEKLKSMTPDRGVITDVWVEEATEARQDDIRQLNKRMRGVDAYDDAEPLPKRLTLSFNPILKMHWIYEDYFKPITWDELQTSYKHDTITILKTTYKDNKFLTQDDISDLENETDEYYYNVYTLGNWGILGDVIFTNWEVADLSEIAKEFDNLRDGQDFGYSADPAAYIKSHYDAKHKVIYILDEVYQTGLDNEALAEIIMPLSDGRPVMCDSAEPKSIAELNKYGVNAKSGLKGPDSIRHGIQWLQKHKIIIDRRCVNFINEVGQYHWKKDKYGESLPVPVDKYNHGIDALRYAYSYDMEDHRVILFGA